MRFGSRIRYSLDLETDAANAVIPSLSLQPLVENAVVHGLSKKENGGILHIRIWKRGEILILSVSDTGLGMSKERCEEVSAAMKERRTSKIGIGLLTPPVGAVLFIGSAVAKIPMEKVVKATLPFYLCMIITLMLITFVPGVSLWLPSIFAH